MASQAIEQQAAPVRRRRRARPTTPLARAAHRFQSLSGAHRRLLVAGVGGLLSLGLGVAAASAVRLPAEIRNGADAPDQTAVRDELPSVTAARAYATNNPPPYVVAQMNDAGPAQPDLYADPVVKADDSADPADGAATPTGPSPSSATDDDASTAERQHDAAAATPAGAVQN